MSKSKYGDVLAIIPARGGSKSVPRKNIISLLGKPMIAWTISNALASKLISRVIVSTDDPEIAEIAKAHGAEVPFLRPPEISGDSSLDIEYHYHALKWLEDNEGYLPHLVVNLRPTSPARVPHIIDSAIATFASNSQADSLRSVHLAAESPFKMWTINDETGYMEQVVSLPDTPEPYNLPRQKLPLVFWQDGYIDITRPEVILDKHSTTGSKIIPFIIEEPATDVDYFDEIDAAESQLRAQENQNDIAKTADRNIRNPS